MRYVHCACAADAKVHTSSAASIASGFIFILCTFSVLGGSSAWFALLISSACPITLRFLIAFCGGGRRSREPCTRPAPRGGPGRAARCPTPNRRGPATSLHQQRGELALVGLRAGGGHS